MIPRRHMFVWMDDRTLALACATVPFRNIPRTQRLYSTRLALAELMFG